MSAECRTHGTDLVGVNEDAFCPVCKAEARAQTAEAELERWKQKTTSLDGRVADRVSELEAELEEARQENEELKRVVGTHGFVGTLATVKRAEQAETALRRAVGALGGIKSRALLGQHRGVYSRAAVWSEELVGIAEYVDEILASLPDPKPTCCERCGDSGEIKEGPYWQGVQQAQHCPDCSGLPDPKRESDA